MYKMYKWILVTGLLAQLLLFSKAASANSSEDGPAAGRDYRLVSKQLLKAAGLKLDWQTNLALVKKGEYLDKLMLVDGRIYALSSKNYLVSLDAEKGNVVFSRDFAAENIPVIGIKKYNSPSTNTNGGKDLLYSVIGNELTEINTNLGTEIKAVPLSWEVVCPPERNKQFYYISGVDKRLHALQADNKVRMFDVAADNDSRIVSVIADDEFVVFGTELGNIISIEPDNPTKLWQFDMYGPLAGNIVRRGNALFMASADTNIYKIDITTKQLIWRYQSRALLKDGPQVTGSTVYQHVPNKGMVAIDIDSGSSKWRLENGLDLLAESQNKAYIYAPPGKLVVMDNEKGKQLYSMNFAGVTKYVCNQDNRRIYIADDSGRVACIEPAE